MATILEILKRKRDNKRAKEKQVIYPKPNYDETYRKGVEWAEGLARMEDRYAKLRMRKVLNDTDATNKNICQVIPFPNKE